MIDQEIISRRFNAFAREKKTSVPFLILPSNEYYKKSGRFSFLEYGLILSYFEDEKITIFSFRRL